MKLELSQIRRFLTILTRRTITDPTLRRSAVLILLYFRQGILHFLFTKRTSVVEHHKGQISFPGGSMDDGDADLIHTALREAHEEIGLDPSSVEILGTYHDQWTPTGFCITPVVGLVPTLPVLSPNRLEVEEIIEIPVAFFLDPAHLQIQYRQHSGRLFEVCFYHYGNHEVWGATAAIVRSFLTDVQAQTAGGEGESTGEGKNPLEIT